MVKYKSAFLKNFGCKVNQAESEYLMEQLKDYFEFVDTADSADIIFVNTCAVTSNATKKTLSFIRNIKKNFPEKNLIVMGCITPLLKEEKDNYSIDLIITNKEKDSVREILSSHSYLSKDTKKNEKIISNFRTRAFLKIQDGCDNFCSYCIIPILRGTPKSKPISIVLNEFRNLLARDYKEVVLVGIHLGKYGSDLGTNLTELLSAMINVNGEFRIRLSSIEINEINENLIDIIDNNKKICPHLHIPLQSGSNKILKLMNRTYSREKFISSINILKKRIPNISIGFDVIAGFPGENEDDFSDTLNLIKELKPHYLHVFPYSDRPYTKAYHMPNKVEKTIISERVSKLRELGKSLKINAYKNKIGTKMRVLIEKNNIGHSDDYFKVQVKDGTINTFYNVIVCEFNSEKLILEGIDATINLDVLTGDK